MLSAGRNVFVKNLVGEVDDDRLRKEFEKFGTITSATVTRDAHSRSRGFGFVAFANPEDALRAIQEMHGTLPPLSHTSTSSPLHSIHPPS